MHIHTSSRQRILLREINKQFDWHDRLTHDEPQTQEWTTYLIIIIVIIVIIVIIIVIIVYCTQ